MDINEAIKHALDGNAILFLGSGASYGAKNLNPDTADNKFKTGVQLSHLLCNRCGDPDEDDLFTSAEIFASKFGQKELIRLLQTEFSVRELAYHHLVLPKIEWKRIYTTNYDDIIETAYSQNGLILVPVTPSSDTYMDKKDICLHINGFIKNLTSKTLNSEFKLTDTSMNSTNFADSLWAELFRQDLKISRAVFFVGFSLKYDLDIKRIVSEYLNPDKTFFVVSPDVSARDNYILSKYGKVQPIGIERFAQLIEEELRKYIPSSVDDYFYTNFEKIAFDLDVSDITPANGNDLIHYYSYGKFTERLLYDYKGKYMSIIKRSIIDQAVNDINDSIKMILFHSDLGNGKTAIIESLKFELVKMNIPVYELVDNNDNIADDVERICSIDEKCVVIVENFFNYRNVFKCFSLHNINHITFIFTARTAIHEMNLERIIGILNLKNERIRIHNVNRLNDEEIIEIDRILNANGFYGQYSALSFKEKQNLVRVKFRGQLQDLILEIFDSRFIIEQLKHVYTDIYTNNSKYIDLIIFTMLVRIMNLEINFNDLMNLFNDQIANDYYFQSDESVKELLDFKERKITFKSAIVAKWLINQSNMPGKVIEVLANVASKADKFYILNKKYSTLLRNIVSYAHLRFVLLMIGSNTEEKTRLLRIFYERVKSLNFYRENNFFWLQYAIACLEVEDFVSAKIYFDTAYGFANDIPGFIPFQINNHYARYLLELSLKSPKNENTFSSIKEAHELLSQTGSDTDNTIYNFRTAANYYPKIKESLYPDMSSDEQEVFKQIVREMFNTISSYDKSLLHFNQEVINRYKQDLLISFVD